MRYTFTEEQTQLRDTVSRFLKQFNTTDDVRRLMESSSGFDSKVWRALMVDLGLGGVALSEEFGEAGLGFVEQAIVLEEMGRELLCAPYLSSAVYAATCIGMFGTEDQKQRLLPPVLDGSLIATVDVVDPANAPSSFDIQVTTDGAQLSGSRRMIVDGMVADTLLFPVPATNGDANDDDSVAIYIVDANAEGVSRTPLEAMDPTRKLAQVDLDGVSAQLLGGQPVSGLEYRTFYDIAITALANEMVGGAQRMLDSAVAYAQERVQFGRTIGSLQAIKHKCAEVLLEVECAKSAAYRAAGAIDDEDADLSEYASIAKASANDAFIVAASECIQIHGGIGFTWENDTHLWFKRAKSSQVFLGNTEHHRERLMRIWDG